MKHFRRNNAVRFLASSWVLLLLLLPGCQSHDKDLEFELKRSFQNYLNALQARREYELRIVVNVPGLKEYKSYVDQLYLDYLENVGKGQVSFDEQGIVLSRFLRLRHYRYGILEIEKSKDGMQAEMKISIHFSYDANIAQSGFEKGTKLYIPGEPFGKVETIVMGGDNPVPRQQLKYIELDLKFRRTNFEGVWQITKMNVIPNSPQFETSIKGDF